MPELAGGTKRWKRWDGLVGVELSKIDSNIHVIGGVGFVRASYNKIGVELVPRMLRLAHVLRVMDDHAKHLKHARCSRAPGVGRCRRQHREILLLSLAEGVDLRTD